MQVNIPTSSANKSKHNLLGYRYNDDAAAAHDDDDDDDDDDADTDADNDTDTAKSQKSSHFQPTDWFRGWALAEGTGVRQRLQRKALEVGAMAR